MFLHQPARSVDLDGAHLLYPLFHGTVSSRLIYSVCKSLSLLVFQALQFILLEGYPEDNSLQYLSFLRARSYQAISSSFPKSPRSYYSTGQQTSKIISTVSRTLLASLL